MTDDPLPVSLDDMIAEVRRELDSRMRLYPKWMIGASVNKRHQMERQYTMLAAVLDHLERERGE